MTGLIVLNPGVAFKNIDGFPGYAVGDDGSVWSCWQSKGRGAKLSDTWKLVASRGTRKGHLLVNLSREGKCHAKYIHRLVLEAFVGIPAKGLHGCHYDGNPLNNCLGNLRWDTPAGNAADMIRHGRTNYGQRCWTAKLNEDSVREIHRRYASGDDRKAIAKDYGVCADTVTGIAKGKKWKHLGLPPIPMPQPNGRSAA